MYNYNNGFIKIHRKLIDHEDILGNPIRCVIFMNMLIRANWKQSTIQWQKKPYKLEPGQLIINQRKFAKSCGVTLAALRHHVEYLICSTIISTLSSTRGTVITICNWSKYQKSEDDSSTPSSTPSNTPATHQQHYMKKGRIKELKNIYISDSKKSSNVPYQEIGLLWNNISGVKYPKIKNPEKLNKSRKSKLTSRWKENPDLVYWENLFTRLSEKCDFSWSDNWRPNFDWIIRDDLIHDKILEGQYDKKPDSQAPKPMLFE